MSEDPEYEQRVAPSRCGRNASANPGGPGTSGIGKSYCQHRCGSPQLLHAFRGGMAEFQRTETRRFGKCLLSNASRCRSSGASEVTPVRLPRAAQGMATSQLNRVTGSAIPMAILLVALLRAGCRVAAASITSR